MTPLAQIEALLKANNLDEAKALANRLRPEHSRLAVLASIAIKEDQTQLAEVLFQRALKLKPGDQLARTNLAKLFVRQKKFKQALPYIRDAFSAAPHQEHIALNFAACLADADKFGSAISALQPFAERANPTEAIILTLSSLLRAHLRPREALELLERGQAAYPKSDAIQRAFADAYAELDPVLAQQKFEQISATQDSVTMRWNRSFVELRLGNFKVGWELYENGLDAKVGKIGRPLPAQVKTVPLVTDLADLDPKKYTLFCSEQGIGDQVLFMGALQEALQDYPRAAIIAEERMVALLQRSFPQVKVYPYAFVLGLTKQTKRLNGVFPIGSLMRHYRPSARSFGNTPEQYLKVSQVHHQKYGALLRDSISSKEIIGISWSGGFWDRQIRTKSIDFETLVRGLMQGEDRRLVCLQYGDTTKERELSKKNGWPVTFINGMDFKKDIDGWVAVAAACDRIVSVSTALVHFMGAIGKRVDLLLSDKQAPFIWGVSEGQSLPYKSVTIWRKKEAETFSELIKRMDA